MDGEYLFFKFFIYLYSILMIYTQDMIPLGVTIYRMLQNNKQ